MVSMSDYNILNTYPPIYQIVNNGQMLYLMHITRESQKMYTKVIVWVNNIFQFPFTSSTPIPTTSMPHFKNVSASSILAHTYEDITPIQFPSVLILHFYTPMLDGSAH